ncbi:MAG TPA: HAD hydrolase family protein [Candidatus Limnocylindrales bacterium]|nr:HAD hydrolase family protein [Candidatus Limnocylindrales bacterium]
MRYFALATDYDGTLALHGAVSKDTLAALECLRATGRKVLLVTGRELDDLQRVYDRLDLFDRVVAENGALLYCPATRQEQPLCEPPPPRFVETLRNRGVTPISVGRVIVATWQPNETVVLETIRDMGLELQVIFNKGAVMVLPSGINKAAGLTVALDQLGLSPHNVVAVGDAENDHAFMNLCECSVAVANALDTIKERADYVTAADHGAGVNELIEKMIANDLRDLSPRMEQRRVVLGTHLQAAAPPEHEGVGATPALIESGLISIPPYGTNILLTGTSGAGKSTLATAIMEGLAEQNYQFCVIDPEGDYQTMDLAVVQGDPSREPSIEAVMELIAKPHENVVVNLLGVSLDHRPTFYEQLLPRILELRARVGRPHWLIVDEAHHLMPNPWTPKTLPQEMSGLMLITVHADSVSKSILSLIDMVIAIGDAPQTSIEGFCRSVGAPVAPLDPIVLESGQALVWTRDSCGGDGGRPMLMRIHPPKMERRRHLRKYAEGDLGDMSFYFRGPQERLNLRAQNLALFTQIAEGVDDETWLHHLRQRDYSKWFRFAIKDDTLADEAEQIETRDMSPVESRQAIKRAIEDRYTAPA